jgi:hypothetical protein
MDTDNLRPFPSNRVCSGADLTRAMRTDEDTIVALAEQDVACDLNALGLDFAEVAREHLRRLITARAQWRSMVLQDREGSARELGADYLRQLEDVLLMSELQPAKNSKKRSKAAH